MIKTADIVSRALRLIQVINPSQTVGQADMQTGIQVLNGMLSRWEADGLSLGFSPVTLPSDALTIPVEAEQAVAYNLAAMLAPEYGVNPLPSITQVAMSGMNDLLRDQAVATPIQPILAVPMPSAWNRATLNGESWYVG